MLHSPHFAARSPSPESALERIAAPAEDLSKPSIPLQM